MLIYFFVRSALVVGGVRVALAMDTTLAKQLQQPLYYAMAAVFTFSYGIFAYNGLVLAFNWERKEETPYLFYFAANLFDSFFFTLLALAIFIVLTALVNDSVSPKINEELSRGL